MTVRLQQQALAKHAGWVGLRIAKSCCSCCLWTACWCRRDRTWNSKYPRHLALAKRLNGIHLDGFNNLASSLVWPQLSPNASLLGMYHIDPRLHRTNTAHRNRQVYTKWTEKASSQDPNQVLMRRCKNSASNKGLNLLESNHLPGKNSTYIGIPSICIVPIRMIIV